MLSGVKLVDRGEAERRARDEKREEKRRHKKEKKREKKVGGGALLCRHCQASLMM